jgi:hypothetical protein
VRRAFDVSEYAFDKLEVGGGGSMHKQANSVDSVGNIGAS